VFGTEFTREKTRQEQQARLDQAVRKLEAQLAGAAVASTANLQGDDKAIQAQLIQAQQKDQLARLRGLKSNGRIALELRPGAATVTDLPNLALEDGDRIFVPSRTNYVMAVGAVNNDNAIIWKPKRTVKDLIKLASPTQSAERDEIFVLRADGTVIGRSDTDAWYKSSWISGDTFEEIELMPGDAIVVPEKLDRRSNWQVFLAGFKDWTQIIYQMGLGVVAWKQLH
jgi:hypothetical protein